jgi:hypothetical protein
MLIEEKMTSNWFARSAAMAPSKSCLTQVQDQPARSQTSLPRSSSKPLKLPSALVWLKGGKLASVAMRTSCA